VFKTLVIATTFDPLVKEYRKQRRRRGKEIVQRYADSPVRVQHNLPFKHYYMEGNNEFIDQKIIELKKYWIFKKLKLNLGILATWVCNL